MPCYYIYIVFTNLPSIHPLSFHEMIFILVYIQLSSQCMIINYFLLCVFRIVVEEEQTSHVQQLNSELQKQLQQLEAALLKLGREHQTLQVNALCPAFLITLRLVLFALLEFSE